MGDELYLIYAYLFIFILEVLYAKRFRKLSLENSLPENSV